MMQTRATLVSSAPMVNGYSFPRLIPISLRFPLSVKHRNTLSLQFIRIAHPHWLR